MLVITYQDYHHDYPLQCFLNGEKGFCLFSAAIMCRSDGNAGEAHTMEY